MLILLQILGAFAWAGLGHEPGVTLFCTSQQFSQKVARITLRETRFLNVDKRQVFVEHGGLVTGNGAFSTLFDQSQVTVETVDGTQRQLTANVFIAQFIIRTKNGETLVLPNLREVSVWMMCNQYSNSSTDQP